MCTLHDRFIVTVSPSSLSSSPDGVLEKAMHKCVLKPLKGVVSAALLKFQVRSGAWQELLENLAQAKARLPQDMGLPDGPPPDPLAMEKIKQKLQTLCKMYSPEKKVTVLLRVCKLIYGVLEDSPGETHSGLKRGARVMAV